VFIGSVHCSVGTMQLKLQQGVDYSSVTNGGGSWELTLTLQLSCC
jgi:hypothetical protein